jgi:hypothetical protein
MPRVVGVDADRGMNLRPLLGEAHRDVVRRDAVAGSDGDDVGEACVAGARQHGLQLGVELGRVEVGVRVEEHARKA